MRDVLKVQVPKSRIMAMPARERAMFLLLGYAANQVALYTKIAILSTNYNSSDSVENTLSAAQSVMILRTVAGVLHETWSGVITKHFLNSPEGRVYVDAMDNQGKEALDKLKKLFGKSGLLAAIRNDFAFHYPKGEEIEAACQLAAAYPETDADWDWYFARSGWNSFYFLSEIIVMHGVLQSAGCHNFADAQKRLQSDMRTANNEMVTLLQGLIAAMWSKNVANEYEATVVAKLHNAPNLFEFSLPYFFDVPEGDLPPG
ncbi:hypothetical protein [Methylosinus sp. KRF6]|uniref:hypothetical protein n=1 Tax=Methylosinus sp. KRF6 TaxID=2846853 RepID=UPI001C0C15C5|nr:hypothetical protein [Methylosinus sp. KRF6]MBU3888716.1 hypothetical protein [Methylosinus sp. KRF6]